jgi:hypothetical protein
MTVNRKLAVNAALVLQYGDTNQATVRGLNNLTLPAMMRSKIKSEEFGVDFSVNDAGGGEHGDIKYSGNMVTGDTHGQDLLRTYLKNNTKFTDARIYLDTDADDFLAPDTRNDATTGFQVMDHTPSAAQKNGTFAFSGTLLVNGQYAYFTNHQTDGSSPTMAFVAAITPGTTSPTITDSASGFVTSGFKAGDTLIVEGSTSNDGMYLILEVAAGTITLSIADSLTAEDAIDGTTLHSGVM